MPPLESMDRYEYALLWVATGENDESGEPAVNPTPVQIRVRIVFKRRDTVDAQGNTIALDAQLHANREIPVGSRVWEGSLDDWTGTGSSDPATKYLYVATDESALDIKGRSRRYQYGLTQHMGTFQ